MRAKDDPVILERYVIPNLRNASRIMKLLAQNSQGCRATDIVRALRVPGTTTLRIMATLQLEGLVRSVKGRFVLGPSLVPLGKASLDCARIHPELPAGPARNQTAQGSPARPEIAAGT